METQYSLFGMVNPMTSSKVSSWSKMPVSSRTSRLIASVKSSPYSTSPPGRSHVSGRCGSLFERRRARIFPSSRRRIAFWATLGESDIERFLESIRNSHNRENTDNVHEKGDRKQERDFGTGKSKKRKTKFVGKRDRKSVVEGKRGELGG